MFDYDKESKYAAETLDKYDFSLTLRKCYGVEIGDIKNLLSLYGEEVENAILNLTTDEFLEYLHQRFGMNIQEVPTYYVWWNDRKNKMNE